MIQGSSIAPEVMEQVRARAAGKQSVLVRLDSNHTHDHVLAELKAYAPLTSLGSYCVVFDTAIEEVAEMSADRPWGPGNNPKTAVWEFLETSDRFEIDEEIPNKLLITVAPDGYLRIWRSPVLFDSRSRQQRVHAFAWPRGSFLFTKLGQYTLVASLDAHSRLSLDSPVNFRSSGIGFPIKLMLEEI